MLKMESFQQVSYTANILVNYNRYSLEIIHIHIQEQEVILYIYIYKGNIYTYKRNTHIHIPETEGTYSMHVHDN